MSVEVLPLLSTAERAALNGKSPRIRKADLPNPTEKQMRMTLEQAAKIGGWRCFFVWSSIHSPAGWPDMWFIRGGEMLFMELKRRGKKPTAIQAEVLDALTRYGYANSLTEYWEVSVVTPDNLQEAIDRLMER